jgi:hypothetical protein
MWPLLIGAALGLAKSGLNKLQNNKDRAVQAETTRWSPWTGMQAPAPTKVDPLGDVLMGGMSGAMLSNSLGGSGGIGAMMGGEAGGAGAGGAGGVWGALGEQPKYSLMGNDEIAYGLGMGRPMRMPGSY